MIRAALDGQTEVVDLLLRKGADVNARNRERRTALMFAVINLHAATVKTLIRDEHLTDAEWRVAEAVARGLSNKEIAAELKLSLRTIEGHISRILDKRV